MGKKGQKWIALTHYLPFTKIVSTRLEMVKGDYFDFLFLASEPAIANLLVLPREERHLSIW